MPEDIISSGKKNTKKASSSIQTLLSVPEFHRIMLPGSSRTLPPVGNCAERSPYPEDVLILAQHFAFDKSKLWAYTEAEEKRWCALDIREISCSFTGHRPTKLPWGSNENDSRCIAMKQELTARLEGIYEAGYRHFICGMAIGCDMYFAEAVLEMQKKYPDVTLEAAIPCGTQPDRWVKALRERYNRILDKCSQVNVLQIDYSPQCMMLRNQYMVDNSSLLLACFDGRPGGTMSTILYAQRQGLNVITIDI